MKIICLISKGKGHLDFGGMGFVKLAQWLKDLGHEVIWLTVNEQSQYLKSKGFVVHEQPYVDALWFPEEDKKEFDDDWIMGLKTIELSILHLKPDVILSDRLLGLARQLCDTLNIPMISLGTPGGLWKRDKRLIVPGCSSHHHSKLPEILSKRLKWNIEGEWSAWCISSLMNIVFMPAEFYEPYRFETSRYINLMSSNIPKDRCGLAISLGNNTADLKKLSLAIIELDQQYDHKQSFDLYGKPESQAQLLKLLPLPLHQRIKPLGYVPFEKALPGYQTLLFSSGISTIWYCIEYGINSLVLPGGIHDQQYNADRLQSLRWGKIYQEGQDNSLWTRRYSDIKNTEKLTFNTTLQDVISAIENLT
jgi:hypothetical protein